MVIGVTGGVGSGKSLIMDFLKEEYNADIIKLDEISADLIEPEGECYERVAGLFGSEIINPDGTFDKKKIAGIIFTDNDKRIKMNSIVHPVAIKKVLELIFKMKDHPYIVMESAILIESGLGKNCDELWYVYSPESVRRMRLKETRNYTDEKINAIMASQLTEEEFIAGCDLIIDNSGDFEKTKEVIRKRMNK